MLIFIPLFAAAVYVLMRDVEGTAARVSRIALIPFVIFYGAFETLQGIGVGTLVNELNGLSEIDQATREDLTQDFAENFLFRDFGVFVSIGNIALVTAMIAAGVALRGRAGAPLSVAILLGISPFLISAHPPPYGPIGLALFIVAVLLFLRSQSTAPGAGCRGSGSPLALAGSRDSSFARQARALASHHGSSSCPACREPERRPREAGR